MGYTETLARYVSELKLESIPQKTVEQTKKLILHVLAASLAAADLPQAHAATRIAAHKGARECATVWGSKGVRASAEDAAFANATLADMLDWEDCAWTGHPSAGAVSVALALGEEKRLSGKEIIEAIVAAYDVYQRFAMSVQIKPEEWGRRSWGLTCWQVFAGATAAGKLYGFDVKDMATCFGVTTHFTNVPGPVREDSDVYHYAHGIAARNGIAAARIVEAGVDPIQHTFDGENSFGKQINSTVDQSWYDRDLGKWFAIDETYLKHWPANMWIQTPLEAWDEMIREHGFHLDDVEKVEVSPDVGLYSKPIALPNTIMKAQFYLPYVFAARMFDEKPSADWYSDDNLVSPRIARFAEKFTFLPPVRNPLEQFTVFWTGDFPEATVRVALKGGKALEKTLRYPKGHPRNNYTWEEECEHFRSCAGCLPAEQVEKVIACVGDLENLSDVNALCENLLIR